MRLAALFLLIAALYVVTRRPQRKPLPNVWTDDVDWLQEFAA